MNAVRLSLENASTLADFEDVTNLSNVIVDLRYGSENNILSKNVYDGFQKVLLHKVAAKKFKLASEILREKYSDYKFIVFDALRPQTAQMEFWNLVKNTPQQPYFADPAKGSIHSYGFAIDLSLVEGAKELDMGTVFDDLSPKAEPRREADFVATGELTALQWENRKKLREVMERAGFIQLPHEWWHFDALPPTEVRMKYARI